MLWLIGLARIGAQGGGEGGEGGEREEGKMERRLHEGSRDVSEVFPLEGHLDNIVSFFELEFS